MPNPSWVTAENIRFNGTLDNAVVLNVTNNVKSLILWDSLSADDQNKLSTIIDNHGGTAPLAAPSPGFQVCDFTGLVVGSDATGLSATANQTAGYAIIDLDGTAVGNQDSGLSADILTKSNAARVYSAVVLIDGTIIKSISVAGDAGDKFSTLITQINNDLGGSATASISSGNIKITSATTGKNSSILIQDTGALFSSLANYNGVSRVSGNESTTYNATVTVDGVDIQVSVVGSSAQTYTTLVAQINTDLGNDATAAIVNGNIKITSALAGANSSVSVKDAGLFKSLTVFKSVQNPVNGSDDLLATLKTTKSACGTVYADLFRILQVGTKPAVPPAMKHGISSVYWNGTEWKYLDTDVTV